MNFFWNTVYFRFGKTNVHHIGILVPFSTSSIPPQSACYYAPGCRVLSKSDHLLRKYDVISIFKNGTAVAQYYFPFRIYWCYCLQKVKVCQQTKFRRNTSIRGWDITTSVFEKQTSAILEFYIRFRSWPFRRNRRVILRPAAEFRPNRNIRRWNMTSYRFSRWRPSAMLYLLCCFGVMAWPPTNSDLKSLVRRINSSGDIAM